MSREESSLLFEKCKQPILQGGSIGPGAHLLLSFAPILSYNLQPMQVTTNAGYIFDQLTDLLERMTGEQYSKSLEIFSGASVGKHYRHIIEFFQCVAVASETENICYDNRLRDERIEKDKDLAIELLKSLKSDFAVIDNEKELILIGDLDSSNNNQPSSAGTTLFREFHYTVEHAIHHMAILKMGIRQTFTGIMVPQEFGVAPSTLRYQHSSASVA